MNTHEETFPLNLLNDVFDENFTRADLPEDIAGSVAYVLETSLTERQRDMLLMRYRDGMTLPAIAEKYSLTRDRIRQILVKAIRILSKGGKSDTQDFLRYGIRETVQKKISAREKLAYEKGYLAASELNTSTFYLVNDVPMLVYRVDDMGKSFLYSKRVDECGMSVRTANCLIRSGYIHIGDVMNADYKAITQVRNFGLKCYHELLSKLEEMGLDCEHLKAR